VTGEISSTQVDEDERTIAFMDVNPVTRGHALVIPRAHSTDLHDIDPEDLAAVSVAAQRLAARAPGASPLTAVLDHPPCVAATAWVRWSGCWAAR